MSSNQRVYTQVPIANIYASSNEDKHEAFLVNDGYLETFWRAEPTLSAGQHFILQFPKKFDVASVDLAFLEGVKRIVSFQIEALVDNGTRWEILKKAQTKGSTNGLMRFNFATVNTDKVKITSFTWQPKDDSSHEYLNAEVTECRVFGYLEDKDLPINANFPNLPCPEGYSKDPNTGACIPIIESDLLKPKKVVGNIAIPQDGDKEQDVNNVISRSTTDTWRAKGVGSYVLEDLGGAQKVYIVDIGVDQKPARAYNLNLKLFADTDLNRPPVYEENLKFDQADLDLQVLLEDPVEARLAKLEFTGGNKDDIIDISRFHLLGESKNVVVEPPDVVVEPEPEPKPPVEEPKPEPPVVEPPKPEPEPEPEPVARLDAQGVRMLYTPKKDGQLVTAKGTRQEESEHNTGTRSSLYSLKPYSANCGELTEGFVMNLKDNDEQNAPKILSGGHTGSGDSNTTRQGRCYAVGVNQNGTLHLAKEYPHHPTTPKAYDQIKYLSTTWKNLGSIKDKFVLMKIVYFPTTSADGKKKGMHIEWWFDRKALSTGKLENDWQQMAYVDDYGDWGSKFGEPYLENNGVKFNGKVLGMYVRIDTPIRPVKYSHVGQYELELPAKKL